MQGGIYAATAILRKVKGQPELPPFHYFDKGSLAVIGRWAAVANAFGVHLSALVAWIVRAFIHLTYIVTFQNRLFGFHPVGDPGLDVQSWSAADHRYCAYRLQLQ